MPSQPNNSWRTSLRSRWAWSCLLASGMLSLGGDRPDRTRECGIPALRALFLFLSFPIQVPAINPSYELATTPSHHHARQRKYAFKPAKTSMTTSSLISFRLTISTISYSLSYEIVDNFDHYPGYFYVSLFSDLENTEIPSLLCWSGAT